MDKKKELIQYSVYNMRLLFSPSSLYILHIHVSVRLG